MTNPRPDWHLAQLNIGRLSAPLDAPSMTEFTNALEPINGIAEAHAGFIWRLTGEDGESSSYLKIPGVDDDLLAANLSVWTDLEALKSFMYKTDHIHYMRRRKEWFDPMAEQFTVLYWIESGELPTLEEAYTRLLELREHGPNDRAWSLRSPRAKPLA